MESRSAVASAPPLTIPIRGVLQTRWGARSCHGGSSLQAAAWILDGSPVTVRRMDGGLRGHAAVLAEDNATLHPPGRRRYLEPARRPAGPIGQAAALPLLLPQRGGHARCLGLRRAGETRRRKAESHCRIPNSSRRAVSHAFPAFHARCNRLRIRQG